MCLLYWLKDLNTILSIPQANECFVESYSCKGQLNLTSALSCIKHGGTLPLPVMFDSMTP